MSEQVVRLTPAFVHVLLALSAGPRHGYALMQEIEVRTAGRIRLGPSSLYYSLARLQDARLIEEVEAPPAEVRGEPHGERRRYYRLTRAGRKRLAQETAVLADIVAHARAQGLLR
jgi:DNA-binding PadR family transcriptional regulator